MISICWQMAILGLVHNWYMENMAVGHVADEFMRILGGAEILFSHLTPAINGARNERPATAGSEFNGFVKHFHGQAPQT